MGSRFPHPMSRRRTRVRLLHRRQGLLAVADTLPWLALWREPYHLMLAVPWPVFFALVLLAYLAINLVFAGLYRLDPAGIGGVAGTRASFGEAFFFSVQTLGSIGYGVLHPTSTAVNLIVTAESVAGMLFIALVTGLAFARFARGTARIRFSEVATVHTYNGLPTLMFRLANERRNTILEARLRAYLAIDEVSEEGIGMRRLLPLALRRDHGVAFLLTWTGIHVIDAASPLHGLTEEDLERAQADLLVAFSGIDETLERPIHARHHYPPAAIRFDHCFVDMVQHHGEQRLIDWSQFHRIRPCPSPHPSPTSPATGPRPPSGPWPGGD
jgi:inward rectifier potassium channel